MDGTGLDQRLFFRKSMYKVFHNTQPEVIWPKEFLKSMHRDKSAKMAKWLFFCQIAILALFSLCIDFKIFFCQMTSRWILWKTYYMIFPKKMSLDLSRPVHVLIWEDKLNYFKFPSLDFKNSFWFGKLR